MRALRIHNDPDPPQAPELDALRRWTERRRELLLEDRLDRLTTALEHLVIVLERRPS
jgi:hypothetical protein